MLGLTPSPLFCMMNFRLKIHHLRGYIIKLHKTTHQNKCNNISATVIKGSQHLIQAVLSSKCFIVTEKNEKVLTSLTAMVRLCVCVRDGHFCPSAYAPPPSSQQHHSHLHVHCTNVHSRSTKRQNLFFSRWI